MIRLLGRPARDGSPWWAVVMVLIWVAVSWMEGVK